LIAAVGTLAEVGKAAEARGAEKIDLGGRVALPGFVDSHTHLVHAGKSAEEYELRIAGASYEEIARKGGGILNSVKSREEFYKRRRAFFKLACRRRSFFTELSIPPPFRAISS